MDYSKWLTPEGVKTGIEFIVVMMTSITAVLSLLGYRTAAAKVTAAENTIEEKEATIVAHAGTIQNATKVAVALVQGVEKFSKNAKPEDAQALKDSITSVTTIMGVEHIVQPLVKAATENTGSASAALVTPAPTQNPST